uniref:Protein sleepless n=1 Tax=Panagrolaimus sp. PS1159 TaxID=55785 RepID=A0AC35GRD8_9BILA
MITTLLPFILILTVYPPPINPLRCYHCSNPSRQIAQNLWIHKSQTCTRRKPMLCPPESVACVIVRVSHPLLSFTASGCSEDKFIGCDLHNLKHINTSMKRCQCSTSYCNKDLHMKGFHISTISGNSLNPLDLSSFTGDLINPKPIIPETDNNKTANQYHIQLLDQLNGKNQKDEKDGDESEELQKQRKHRLKMLKKQKQLQQRQQEKLLNAGNNFFKNISLIFSTVIFVLLKFL